MAGTQSHAPFTPDAAVFCKPGECQKLWTALQNGGKRREFGNWFQQSTQKLSEKVLNGNLSWKDVTVFVNYMCLSGKIVRAVSKASKDVNVQVSAAYSFAVDTERENGSDELAVGCSYPGKPFPCGIMEANLLSDVMANNHLLTERDAFIRIQEKSVTRGQCFVSATQRRRAHAKRNEHAPNIDNFSDRFSARSQSSVVVNRGDSTATRRCLTAKRTRSDDRVESEMELHSTESRDVEGLKETILNGHDFYERVKRIKQETGLEADLQDSEAHYMVVTEGNEGRPEEDDGETSSLEDDQAMDGSESCLSETDAFMHTASVNHSANDSEEMGANSSGGEDIFSGRDVTPETSGMGQCDLNTEADFTESAGPSPLSATMKTPEGAVEDDVEPPSPNPANGRRQEDVDRQVREYAVAATIREKTVQKCERQRESAFSCRNCHHVPMLKQKVSALQMELRQLKRDFQPRSTQLINSTCDADHACYVPPLPPMPGLCPSRLTDYSLTTPANAVQVPRGIAEGLLSIGTVPMTQTRIQQPTELSIAFPPITGEDDIPPSYISHCLESSNSMKNFAKRLAFLIYSPEERYARNCSGKTYCKTDTPKSALSPRRLNKIRNAVFHHYPEQTPIGRQASTWKSCKDAIDKGLRDEMASLKKV